MAIKSVKSVKSVSVKSVNTASAEAINNKIVKEELSSPSADLKVRKTKLNQWGTETIMYGDKFPKVGTSGRAIWDACVEQGITVDSITKVETFILANLNLIAGNGKPVNPANISIEINSYKKYLKNTTK